LERMAGRFGAVRLAATAAEIKVHAERRNPQSVSSEISCLRTGMADLATVVAEYETSNAS
jgi:hypothetical protein